VFWLVFIFAEISIPKYGRDGGLEDSEVPAIGDMEVL